MPRIQRYKLTCPQLADYFRQAFRPRDEWMVGIEVETMGRDASTSRPLAYEADGPSVRRIIEAYAAARGGAMVFEGDRPVGIDATCLFATHHSMCLSGGDKTAAGVNNTGNKNLLAVSKPNGACPPPGSRW